MLDNVVKRMQEFIDMGVPGCEILVYKDGKQIFRHSEGYVDRDKKIPFSGKERYNIYSCSKLITCVAALQLWEKGLFKLEDKLSDYIPEFENMTVKTEQGIVKAEKPILITHLFEMTAGFSYDVNSPSLQQLRIDTDGKCPTVEAIKYLAKEPLLFEPGTRWNYSLCHDVLAALVEIVSGVRFSDYVQKNIFDPLNMQESSFCFPESERVTLAAQYQWHNDIKEAVYCGPENLYNLGREYESGGAGCVSTVDDYMKFLEGLRVGKLLKNETVDLMATNRLDENQIKSYWPAHHGYGLGVRCKHPDRDRDDFGWGGAAGAYLAIDKSRNLSIYYAQHMLSSPNSLMREELYKWVIDDLGI
ncbi:MAG: beta-lactamase family protein [Clostridia bacterium]|nr:beta-lactamase family protein [Clostridia bacterium]